MADLDAEVYGSDADWSSEFDVDYSESTDAIFAATFKEEDGYNISPIVTDNGTGYIVRNGGGSIIIPPNSQDCDTLAMLVCGEKGLGNTQYGKAIDGPQLIDNAQNGEFPPYPVVLAKNDLSNPSDRESSGLDMLNTAYDALTQNGSGIKNVGGMGFSNGAYGAAWTIDKFLGEHKDDGITARIYLADEYNIGKTFNNEDSSLPNLKNNNVKIIMSYIVDRVGGNGHKAPLLEDATKLFLRGFNITLTNRKKGEHADACWDFFDGNWGYAYLAGAFDSNDLPKEGKYTLVANQPDLLPLGSTSLSANTKYVYDEMNKIRVGIKNSLADDEVKFESASFPHLASVPSVISKINECVNLYNETNTTLMTNMFAETEVVYSVAQTIDAIDDDLEGKAQVM